MKFYCNAFLKNIISVLVRFLIQGIKVCNFWWKLSLIQTAPFQNNRFALSHVSLLQRRIHLLVHQRKCAYLNLSCPFLQTKRYMWELNIHHYMLEFLFVILCLYQLTRTASQLSSVVIPINRATTPRYLTSLKIIVKKNNSLPPSTRAKMLFKGPTLGSIQVIKCPHPRNISQALELHKDGKNTFSFQTKSLQIQQIIPIQYN